LQFPLPATILEGLGTGRRLPSVQCAAFASPLGIIVMLSLLTDPHRRHLLLTVAVGAGLVAYLTGSVRAVYGFDLTMLLALFGGLPIYYASLSSLLSRKITADLAVSLAAFAALYLGYTGMYEENMYLVAAEVIFIMLIGETLENFAVGRTRQGIAALLALRPETARVRRRHRHDDAHAHTHDHGPHSRHHHHDHEEVAHDRGYHDHRHDGHHHDDEHDHELVVPVDHIRSDDVVIVRPGDRIPVDGRVLSGTSSVDQSPITGESLPADKTPDDEVFAGTINQFGSLELAVERLGEDTTLEQIIHLVEEAEAAKAPTQRLADRYATWFVPIVLGLAGLTYLATGDTWFTSGSIIRAVAVLVVACPCALVLATPTAIAAGIGSLVRRGVLIKGGVIFERLGRLRAVVFDKTGTLTLARLRIAQIAATEGHGQLDVLRLAAAVERDSEHPIGRLIVERAEADGIERPATTGFTARPGMGAEANVESALVRVGSPRFIEQAGIGVSAEFAATMDELGQAGCTVVLVARGEELIGAVAVQDTVRPDAREAIGRIRALGIDRIVMLTGDNPAAAGSVAAYLDIDDTRASLLPPDKVEAVRQLQRDTPPVAMVGDGINDAPSLATADVGVAMAEIGTDVAIASADVVLVGDDLRKLPDAIETGRRALAIIWQNILAFALVFNGLAVAAASLGWIGPVAAAVVHQVGSLAVVLNSLRLLFDRRRFAARREAVRLWIERRRRRLAFAVVALALLVYAATGLHVVGVGEVAVVKQFGRIVRRAEPPGLHYRLPWPLGSHRIVRPDEVRRVEIGFRTSEGDFAEPPAYEWNVQHRGGRHERLSDESTVWTGDENLVDVSLVVQYRVADPVAALVGVGEFRSDGGSKWDMLVRDVAEAALRAEMARRPLEDILSARRPEIEAAVEDGLSSALARYRTGFTVERVCLSDVHPPLDVVPAFREVASALEQKEATINNAEAYQFEKEALALGEAVAKREGAEASGYDRTRTAAGNAERFSAVAGAYAEGREVTRLRIYLETVEKALAGRKKVILDRPPDGSRRQLLFGPKGGWTSLPRMPMEESGAALDESVGDQGSYRP